MDENRLILVIDDEEIVHSSVKRILTRLGYKVEGVFTAQEALQKLEQNSYDAVITDLMMPEMNGIDMLHQMKKRKINVPTIMITGYPTIKTAIQALRLGAVDYIPKPFTRQELLSPLSRALRRSDGAETEIAGDRPADEIHENEPTPSPGDCFYLPGHSWALYNQDGTVDIGVENGFMDSIPTVEQIETPLENDIIEQGYPGLKLKAALEVHSVFMPLSGRVVAVNEAITTTPSSLYSHIWVLRIIPSQLRTELASLRRRSKC